MGWTALQQFCSRCSTVTGDVAKGARCITTSTPLGEQLQSQLTCRHRPDVGPMMALSGKLIGPMAAKSHLLVAGPAAWTVYFRDGSAQTGLRTATVRWKLRILTHSGGNRKFSVMIRTLLYFLGSCERHSKLRNTDVHHFETCGSPFFFFCVPKLDLWGSSFFFCVPQLYVWGSPFFFFFFCLPRYISGVHHSSSSSASPAISLGFTILLLLLRSPDRPLGFTILFLLRSSARPLGFTILLLLLRSPARSLGFTILFLLLRSPARSLGFTIILLLRTQLDLWGSLFFFFFVCVPS